MGAIGEQELMKWEKMQGEMNGGEEKVVVLVRLRPLNEKEIARDEVSDWECINETTILYRNSLQERSGFPTAYTYDRVFRGDCPTRLVYEEGTKEIAMSVVGGINSTIFAYGQTSSGKTYTMNGITDYAVADIYEYVQKHEERAFVLKFSAIEIYNEVVRDLLAPDNTQLRLLDDPEKGVIVEKLTEETLRDQSHLKELLSICEAQRQIGETSLNDASSRSHQILKLTIESSSREFLGKDKSTTLAASVNFVDLAGSERASQALSVGQRLKEGSHINRSLLTLGTVIRKLSNGRQGHVNYRDSKLTRILQPSLGGNARTTIICTVSPARSHVEQSRNTLLFASCAKEVTTNAQVNVVMSDKALVKHLQKELSRLESEIRTPAAPNCDHLPLLRKKDQQIGKLENDVRELTKQLELAHSRMEDLLQANESNQTSRQWGGLNPNRKWQEHNKWEDECSVSESSFETNPSYSDIAVQKPNTNWPSSSLSSKNKFALSTLFHSKKKHLHETRDNSDEMCKEVRCIETYDSNNDRIPESVVSSPNTPTDRNLNFMKKHNFNANLMSESSMPEFQTVEQSEKTPPSGYENSFRRKHWKFPQVNYGGNDPWLSESDSQSSVGSELLDELREHKNRNTGDEDIPSIDSFVAGLKEMAQLQYEKQLLDDKVQEMEKLAAKSLITMNDTTELDPMQEYPYHYSPGTTASDWPLRFQRLQASILELWQACNVSLVHRTYFFLLFKGDPTDSIYMEVELRRLSFLKETLSKRHPLTSNPSKKALRREFELLSRLMYKRFTEEERNRIYRKWGINLDSKRRRLELIRRLWSDTKDMNRIKDSASIIAKLIKFSEKNQAPKELFGLSFKPLRLSRRSFGWNKHGMSSSLI